MRKWSHKECFDFFEVHPKNPRWSWSGRNEDGSIVAVTLWKDLFTDGGRTYSNAAWVELDEWRSRPGFVELIDNLCHARDHALGIVRVILATPKDPHAIPRSIDHCYPQEKLRMCVTSLDEQAGTFTLTRIG